jgi:hypothetical protein
MLAILHFVAALSLASPDTTCLRDLDEMTRTVEQDYAGYVAKTTGARAATLRALTDSVRRATSSETDAARCTGHLVRWIAFFEDGHLGLTALGAAPVSTPARDNMPSLAFRDDSSAVLRLPSFGGRWKGAIDSLIAAHRTRLLATPYLIVDVRGNTGGGAATYDGVIPLLYTDSMLVDEFETWASPGNIAGIRRMLASPSVPPHVAAEMRRLVEAMEQRPGEFVRLGPRRFRTDTVRAVPRRVAVVVDRACVSACELFVIDALSSRKTLIVGTSSTGGVVDYGNVRPVALPSGLRRLSVPTGRSQRLPSRPYDNRGILPGALAPDTERDLIEFARRQLTSPAHAPR